MFTVELAAAGLIAAVAWIATALVYRTYAAVPQIKSIAPLPHGQGPRVSIVVAARNEEQNIRSAVASLLQQDYHDVELIVVEDRSTDRTAAILDQMALKTERLKVINVTDLPSGWLGKNNALHAGAQWASGEIILFIDGDIILERTTVSRAVAAMEGQDHVTIGPQMDLPTPMLQAVVCYFLTWGAIALRLWEVNDPKSKAFCGVGAFNMVRSTWYRQIGGHAKIRMRPDDDLMLGKLLKHSGARQRVLFGIDMVGVEWYSSLAEATRGFRKNSFAALQYNVALFVGSILVSIASGVWPFIAMWVTSGTTQLVYTVAVAGLMAGFAKTASEQRMPLWLTPLYPIAALIQLGMLVIAVTLTLKEGGIDWRGTFYSLRELRANKV